MMSVFTILWLAFAAVVTALSSSGSRLLVVLDEGADKAAFSTFWGDLEGRGYHLTYTTPKSSDLNLFRYGEKAYDHLLLFPSSSKGLGPNLAPKVLLDFMQAEGNILLALSAENPTPSTVSSLLLELDIHLPSDRNALVVDHFKYDEKSAGEKHDVVLVRQPEPIRPDLKGYFAGERLVAFPKTVGQVLGNASPLLAPIVRAPKTAYSYNPKDEVEGVEELFASGQQLNLVSAMQARNSARLTVLGSVESLKNEWFDAKVQVPGDKEVGTGNREFAQHTTEWTFKEKGVLKVGPVRHYLDEGENSNIINETAVASSEINPKIYRIKNKVTFTIELSEYWADHYIPYTFPRADALQLEFSMLSPFHRVPLKPVGQTTNATIFGATFTTPDQHGIFNFVVNYKRPFLTNVYEKHSVTVRHFAHDEWPRSWKISGAWTWIGGVWVTVIGWLGFVAVWLYSEPVRKEKAGKKAQ